MPSFTCISCRVAFADGDIQRAHYKSDWHRYNLKRKVAEMPPITADSFREKVLAQKAESTLQTQEKESKHCDVCSKFFSTENALVNHLQSKKHEQQAKIQISQEISESQTKETSEKNKREPQNTRTSNSSSKSGNDHDDEEDDEEYEEDDDESLETTQCLFCPHFSPTFENNMRHMTRSHSFFIPDLQYITNVEELVGYLGEKVGLGKLCLYCNTKGKAFYSIEAVQKHMVDKGHCKILYEGDAVLEYSDFYDFSSSYPEQQQSHEDESSDAEVNSQDNQLAVCSTGELCLPSGAKVGHRSLKRYFKQNLRPEQVKRNEIVVRGLMSDYKMLGWSGGIGKANRLKIQDVKMKNKFKSHHELKLGLRGNKLQTHFREQVMY